jgi:Chaperone of endosialidase
MEARAMTLRTSLLGRLFLALVLTLITGAFVYAQTSVFTYQGRFTDAGSAANGTYDMQFKLFDGTGNQVGSTITNGAVQVSSGIFAVQLDFGAAAFPGPDRFLEIGVRSAGNGEAYTVLSPRQQLTSAVYAIRAGSTATADTATNATTAGNATQLGGVAANQYVLTSDSRLGDARTPTAGSANYIQNNPGNKQNGSFNINGSGTAASLSASAINAVNDYYINGVRMLHAAGSFNLFAGAGAGSALTNGSFNAFFGNESGSNNTTGSANTFFGATTGAANKSGSNNAFFGAQSGFKNVSGIKNTFIGEESGYLNASGNYNTFVGFSSGHDLNTDYNTGIGYGAGEVLAGDQNTFLGAFANPSVAGLTNATAIGYNAKVSQSNSIVLGNINNGQGSPPDTNVGIGTTAPNFRLTVKTATSSYGMVHTDGTVTVGTFVGGSTGGGWIGTRSNHSLSFFINDGGPAMTLETSGFLKLNNVDAGGQLQLCLGPTNRISFCSSSLRYKTALKDFKGGLNVVNRLRPITFDWKEGGMHDLGFGAEDVAAVEPLLVTRNDKGQVEGVKYDRISAVLVNAVKEQQEQIKQQREQIDAQQTQLNRQQQQIESLKRLVKRRLAKARP